MDGSDIMDLPYVSIVIPVLNGARHINSCLKSLTQLEYPENNFEILVVDNGSTDGTIEIIRAFQTSNPQIKLHSEKVQNSYVARNLGVMNAKGQIIAFTDVDCIVDKNWLINLVKGFSRSLVGGVAGEILPGDVDSLIERYCAKAGIVSQKATMDSEFLPYPQTANVAYRKKLFDRIGNFNRIISCGDADFAWRVRLETDYKIVYAPDAILFHRHRQSLKGLFKQQFKYGYGGKLLYEKYKKFYGSALKYRLNTSAQTNYMIKIINYLKAIKSYLVLSGSKKADDLLLLEPLLYIISRCGYRLGWIYASVTTGNYLFGIFQRDTSHLDSW